jgi:hypothetical protein
VNFVPLWEISIIKKYIFKGVTYRVAVGCWGGLTVLDMEIRLPLVVSILSQNWLREILAMLSCCAGVFFVGTLIFF